MKDEFHHRGEFSDAPLTEREKNSILARLRVFMDAHPTRAPFTIRALDSLAAFLDAPIFRRGGVQFAAGALGLVLILGTGTAYAAGGALPGEPLYSIKVNIEEPIQGAFVANSAQAEANWSAQLAGRRLTEAETLAVQNKLTPATEATVTSGLDQATIQFDASVAEVATSSGDAGVAASLASNMEATLAANTQVLTQLQSAVPSAAHAIAPLLSRVKSRALAIDKTRTQLTVAAAQNDATEGEPNPIHVSAAIANVSSSSASSTESASSSATVAAIASAQTAQFDAQVAQIRADITDQLKSATGISLSATTTPVVATSTAAVTVDASTTEATTSSTTIDATQNASVK